MWLVSRFTLTVNGKQSEPFRRREIYLMSIVSIRHFHFVQGLFLALELKLNETIFCNKNVNQRFPNNGVFISASVVFALRNGKKMSG